MSFAVGSTTSTWAENKKIVSQFYASLPSTNALAKTLNLVPGQMQLVLTDHQTAGKGRSQNTWHDQPGAALLSSWIFDLDFTPLPTLTCRVGLALIQALSTTWPWLEFSLKAPNDIYLGSQKLAGLLLENIQQGVENRVIIGLGMNVFAQPNLTQATFLAQHLSQVQLTAKEWHLFLDRLRLELTIAVSQSTEKLSLHDQTQLLYFLNLYPLLSEKYLSMDPDGSLLTQRQQISWMTL